MIKQYKKKYSELSTSYLLKISRYADNLLYDFERGLYRHEGAFESNPNYLGWKDELRLVQNELLSRN